MCASADYDRKGCGFKAPGGQIDATFAPLNKALNP